MVRSDGRFPLPLFAALGAVALGLGGLWIGYEPITVDPDVMYRPIKSELSRALGEGTLPLWSDRFGVGTPLAAESHVAAFYPPNWVLYRLLSVPVAYRLSMWVHYLALVAATYFYARALRLTTWGAALAALAFALCGFQASHASHEPFYHLMPFLPLALGCTERYLVQGRVAWLPALALVLGAQFTLGHFQIQIWTAGLVLLTALWRVVGWEASWRRGAAVVLAVAWGLAIAAVQLALTYELTKVVGFARSLEALSNYAFPPAHWAQLALPALYLALDNSSGQPYWRSLATSGDEACLYVGTVPLILAGAGWLARRDRALGLWRWLAPFGLLLATMPHWYHDGFEILLHLPIIGHFRAPARYTLVTSLSLCLLAGRGFERSLARRRFWTGYVLIVILAVAATAWGTAWSSRPEVAASLARGMREPLILASVACWIVALGTVAAWRSGRLSPWVPLLLAAVELTALYYRGSTHWGWAIPFPGDSPVLRRLEQEPAVGRVTGAVRNLPVRLGLKTGNPYLGITPPAPNYLLESIVVPQLAVGWDYRPFARRFGITHGVIDDAKQRLRGTLLYRGRDTTLDAILNPGSRKVWRLERYEGAFPDAHAAARLSVAEDWYEIFLGLEASCDTSEVWFLRDELPPASPGPRARTARVLRWDGRSGVVEHDGTCDLLLLRVQYPGWFARVDDGPEVPVARADGGFQAIRLTGAGVTKVSVHYRPTHFVPAARISLGAVGAAVTLLAAAALHRRRPAAE